jgi:hypothetical protein
MTLVETTPDETEAEFRAAIDAALQAISPERPRWWHPYKVRGAYEYRGIRFRHFHCIASSVEGWLWIIATKRGGDRRVILPSDKHATVFGPVKMYGKGEQVVIDEREVVPVGRRYNPRGIRRSW